MWLHSGKILKSPLDIKPYWRRKGRHRPQPLSPLQSGVRQKRGNWGSLLGNRLT